MATYDLSGLWLNGERIIFDDAWLETAEGLETATWGVVVDGAHMLAPQVNERVAVAMATTDSHRVEGEALVTDAGHHDEATKIYYGVRFGGNGKLHERH